MHSKSTDIGKEVNGLVVNALLCGELNPANLDGIHRLAGTHTADSPEAWIVPDQSLHITLFDLVSPLVDYDAVNKARLVARMQEETLPFLQDVSSNSRPFDVEFMTVCRSGGVLWIEGRDRGEFARLREQAGQTIALYPGTKPAPSIVHVTLARNLDVSVRPFRILLRTSILIRVGSFSLVHEERWPMLGYEILADLPLKESTHRNANEWVLAA